MLKNTKLYIFISLVTLALFLILVFFFFYKSGDKNGNNKKVPAPTSIPNSSSSNNYFIDKSTKEEQRKQFYIENVINQLPHYGKYFSLYYNIGKNEFILVLDKNNLNQANKDFIVFLRQNGVSDASWFNNLTTTYK